MVREFAISVYLFVFRILFYIFNFIPQKKKTTFVTSFGDNVLYTVSALEQDVDDDIIILKTKQCRMDFDAKNTQRTVLLFEITRPVSWLCSIYHLATSRVVFVDNYFGFLAVSHFKENVTCVQLWHAAGAIKQFGLKDPSNKYRSKRATRRFQKVYDRFDHVVVGSEAMASIFQKSFGLPDGRMLRTGIPRTDFYFNHSRINDATKTLNHMYPLIKDKKIILYAPTFRDSALGSTEVALDIKKLYDALHHDYVLLLRLHPAIQGSFDNQYPDFVVDVSDYPSIHHLLVVTDLLITDYSSIPFEFSLLDRPMVFFAYDLEEYTSARGFWSDYETLVPGPIVRNTEALVNVMQTRPFDDKLRQSFTNHWNEYSDGHSSERLIKQLY